MSSLADLDTPALILDRRRMDRNIERLAGRMRALGVGLRPHLKTAKSWEVVRRMLPSPAGPATVSTLREAEEFAAMGVRDIVYAVGIAPQKLGRVRKLRERGCDVCVILDSEVQARAAAAAGVPALIELDADGHRAGIAAGDHARLLALADAMTAAGGELRGVLTHAGGSYHAHGAEALAAAAEAERRAVIEAAAALRAAGHACPVVSVGSTPTAHFARDLGGVTEVRAGVYVFFDLVMADLGVCSTDDIACTVLATVIGHQRAKGWTLVDAGWMALSRDRGNGGHGYGRVCDASGAPIPGAMVAEASQEHGVVTGAPDLPVGARVRILPNHACATAAAHDRYHVVAGGGAEAAIEAVWPRFNYW